MQAVVDLLSAIDGQAPYENDLSPSGRVQRLRRAGLAIEALPAALVTIDGLSRRDHSTAAKVASLRLTVDAFPSIADDDADVSAAIASLVGDIDLAVCAASATQEPPLGIAGVLQLSVDGWVPYAVEEVAIVGAEVRIVVDYLHDIENPDTFGGA